MSSLRTSRTPTTFWPDLLTTWIPRAEAASSGPAWCGVLKELAAGLNDSHVHLSHPDEKEFLAERFGGWTIPVAFRSVGDRVLVDAVDPACEGDLPVGAEVMRVDDGPVTALMTECARHVSASTPQSRARQSVRFLGRGGHGTVAELAIVDDSGTRTVALRRTMEAGLGGVILPGLSPTADPVGKVAEFGFLDLVTVRTEAEVTQAFETLGDCPGLILDIRGYPTCHPRGSVVPRLIRSAVDSAHYATPIRSGSRRAPEPGGDDWAMSHWAASHYRLRPDDALHYAGPVAVLVDERTMSQSEDFCICLRNAGRATFVGSGTAGANGNVTWAHIPGGSKLSFTGMAVTYADGSRFQNVGIEPDVLVLPTPEGIRAGRDEVLEAAVEVLRGQLARKAAAPEKERQRDGRTW